MPKYRLSLVKKFYDQMLLIRRFEEAAAKAYATGKIRGFCHLYIGEEAVTVGTMHALQKEDNVLCTYRDHGHALARGMNPNALMAELHGKKTGVSGGMGGSMHLFDTDINFMGGHGIVGGHVAVAAGLAFASQYKKERAVTVCFLGEGATNIGGFHEGLSLAALWSLPVVFVIENNLYAMGTPLFKSQRLDDLSQKAKAYNMASDRLEAKRAIDVYETMKKAIIRARAGEGPTLVEMITYRYRGHSMSDPAKYRTTDEVNKHKEEDSIKLAKEELLASGQFTSEELMAIDQKNKDIAAQASQFAEKSEFPPLSSLKENIFQGAAN